VGCKTSSAAKLASTPALRLLDLLFRSLDFLFRSLDFLFRSLDFLVRDQLNVSKVVYLIWKL
jgi:hypothetical protein